MSLPAWGRSTPAPGNDERIDREDSMRLSQACAVAAATMFISTSSYAQRAAISDDVVKIGVLTDMSGQFSHESGEGSVMAVRMAIEDFGGKVLEKPIELVAADHQNKSDIATAK